MDTLSVFSTLLPSVAEGFNRAKIMELTSLMATFGFSHISTTTNSIID